MIDLGKITERLVRFEGYDKEEMGQQTTYTPLIEGDDQRTVGTITMDAWRSGYRDYGDAEAMGDLWQAIEELTLAFQQYDSLLPDVRPDVDGLANDIWTAMQYAGLVDDDEPRKAVSAFGLQRPDSIYMPLFLRDVRSRVLNAIYEVFDESGHGISD